MATDLSRFVAALCGIATASADRTLREYQLMRAETEKVKHDDLSLLAITESSIHGRGVTVTRPLAKDTPIGVLFYEVAEEMEDYVTPSVEGYWHARGFITDGGSISSQRMSVRDALIQCNEMKKCEGITFKDEQQLFSDPNSEIPTTIVEVEFKDKTHFGTDPENSWQSYLKQSDGLTGMHFPLGCSSIHLPNPLPSSLDPELMLPCWPRYVNHSCQPTAVLVKVPVPDGFILPGLPWKNIRCAYQAVALGDLNVGDEITLNYEVLPNYMLRRVEGVQECGNLKDEL